MPKPLTRDDIVRIVKLAKIHLECSIADLETLVRRLEAMRPSAVPAFVEIYQLHGAIEGLTTVATTLKRPPWSAPVPPE